MKKWIDVNDIGELVIEIVLVRFDVPLLFVCLDKDKSRYIVLCVDEEEGKYLLARCSNQEIISMLNNEIPMDEVFRCSSDGKNILLSYNFSKKTFDSKLLRLEELTEDMLPDKGTYFELKNQKIKEYIAKLEDESFSILNMKIKSYSKNYMISKAYDCVEAPSILDTLGELQIVQNAFILCYLNGKVQFISDLKAEEENLQYCVYKMGERRKMYAI